MNLKDKVDGMYGRLAVYKLYPDGSMEKVHEDFNSISYRAKTIMSRLLGGGMNNNGSYTFGSGTPTDLMVSGMAFGNGGHLIYDSATSSTAVLPKVSGLPLIVDAANTAELTQYSAMPHISGSSWGYSSTALRSIPGSVYEKVENGNVPWDGTLNIEDNAIGVTQPHTTLYSETFRVPLDATDGVTFPTNTEVQFKATIPQSYLNYSGKWGFSAQNANLVSEAGLITGYCPTTGTINTGQLYSTNGAEPESPGSGYEFDTGTTTNFNDSLTAKESGLTSNNDTEPQTVTNGQDSFASATNTWNLFSRKTFPAIPKTSAFALVFIWTVGF